MKIIFALLFAISFWACDQNARYREEDSERLSVTIHLVPQAFFGTNGASFSPRPLAVINIGDEVELWGVVHLGDSILTEEQSSFLVTTTFWVLGTDTLWNTNARHKFTKAESVQAVFHLVELGGDTLRDSMQIFVNTPLSIHPQSPQAGQLDVQPDLRSGLPFVWKLAGVDPWELSISYLYIGLDPATLMDSDPLAETSAEEIRVGLSEACPDTSQCKFYWRIVAVTASVNEDIPAETDSSQIRFFQTRRTDTDSGEIVVQVRQVERALGLGNYVRSTDASGRLSPYWSFDSTTGLAHSPLLAPGVWTVVAGDSLHPEFRADSLVVSLSSGSLSEPMVELLIVDVIPPHLEWINPGIKLSLKDSLVFRVSDLGTGLGAEVPHTNWNRLGASSLSWSLHNDLLTLRWTSLLSSDFESAWFAIFTDLAGNSNAHCTFKLKAISTTQAQFEGFLCNPDLFLEAGK